MNHRERVITALSHREPDRCPMQVSFTPEFAARLQADLAMNEKALNLSRKVHNPHGGGNSYELDRLLDQDMLLTSVGWANGYYQSGDEYIDEWGVTWRSVPYETRFGAGRYTEMAGHPLARDGAISQYHAPDPNLPELYRDAQWTLEQFQNEYWIVGVTVTTIWEAAWGLRGYERLLSDLVLNPDLAENILDIPHRYHLTAAKRLVEMGVDMIWIGDDVGSQRGMLISPRHWRKYLKPRMAAFISSLKEINPRVKVAYHSDGMIEPVIPDLIEIGLDILNPVQPACMDPAELKQLYGDRLCFWGTIDQQETLPFGTPADVRRQVLERIRTVGKDGGLIIGPTHHVQLDTPMANFWAMIEAITQTPRGELH